MKQKFSTAWISSTQRRKQRKYRAHAPYHIKQKFLGAHLSKELREKYKIRSFPIRKGDRVKILRGSWKGKEGKVDSISRKYSKIFLDTIKEKNADGTERFIPIHPSNVIITSLLLEDKKRMEKITKQKKEESKEKTQDEKKDFKKEKQEKVIKK